MRAITLEKACLLPPVGTLDFIGQRDPGAFVLEHGRFRVVFELYASTHNKNFEGE